MIKDIKFDYYFFYNLYNINISYALQKRAKILLEML
jgi:hypothetical protein